MFCFLIKAKRNNNRFCNIVSNRLKIDVEGCIGPRVFICMTLGKTVDKSKTKTICMHNNCITM